MGVEQGDVGATVKIRKRGGLWILYLGLGGSNLAFAAACLRMGWRWFALLWLAAGCCYVATALVTKTLGVDLRGEFAIVRSPRRRSIPWLNVRAVLSAQSSSGSSAVRLILGNGEQVTLRYPNTVWREGDTQYERDFQRIDQWWQANRSASWRPDRAEASRPRAHGHDGTDSRPGNSAAPTVIDFPLIVRVANQWHVGAFGQPAGGYQLTGEAGKRTEVSENAAIPISFG